VARERRRDLRRRVIPGATPSNLDGQAVTSKAVPDAPAGGELPSSELSLPRSGAPKVAAMQMISTLETSPRGVYCGAVGRVRPSGDATFSVAIRTATIESATGAAEYSVGGGITWDSVAATEYDEVRAKAAVLTASRPEFSLLETMRLELGAYVRLDAHLARLQESARSPSSCLRRRPDTRPPR
jgi:hypothetical protein